MGTLSCKKDEAALAFDVDAMRNCHLKAKPDSLSMAQSLLGKWNWVHTRCDFGPATGSDTLYRGLQVEFREDGTLTVYQDGQQTQSTGWQLENYGGTPVQVYGLRIDNGIMQLDGFIYVCGDQVVFSNKPLDACDNFYRRAR